MNSRPRRYGAAPLSLSLLAILAGACSSMETGGLSGTGAGGDEGGSAPNDSGGEGSQSSPMSDGEWGDESGGAGTTSGGSWPGGTGGEDPSGEPPDDSGQGGTTGGEDEGSTGDASSSSTGEPVDACDAQAPVTLYLSPDDSNSTSSPVQARDAVLLGSGSLYSVPIRPWEFLNYYSFAYQAAAPGMVRVTPEMARLNAPEETYALQIGVSSPEIANADRPLMNVTLVLDESGSMEGEPIELEREVCRQIAGSLRAGDVVSLVGWDTSNAVKMSGHTISGPNDPDLVAECDALAAGGGTDLNGGLIAGYDLAHEHFNGDRINRVVLISDGGANAGVTDKDLIAAGAGSQDQDGIYLVGVGVGEPEWYNDELMDTVTDVGRGASLFVGSAAEAEKMFKDRFVATMHVAARDVRVRLDLPPGFEVVKFSGEEISSNPEEVEPQHLAPNDVMVFHQTLSTCAPQLIDEEAKFEVTVRFRDAVTFEQKEVIESRKFVDAINAQSPLLLKGSAVFEYATALKAWRDGPDHAAALAPAFTALAAAEAALPGDPDLAEIRQVLAAVQAMG